MSFGVFNSLHVLLLMFLYIVDCTLACWQITVHYQGIRGIVQNVYLIGSSMLQKTSACHSITVVVEEMIIGLRLRKHVKMIALPKWVSFLKFCCSLVPEVE
jgi:hypothetical protein